MPNNIEHVKVLKGSLAIRWGAAVVLVANMRHRADACFLDDLKPLDKTDRDEVIPVECPHWCGELSNRTYENYLEALAECDGEAELLLIWEDGEMGGLLVKDGTVEEMKVLVSLVKEKE